MFVIPFILATVRTVQQYVVGKRPTHSGKVGRGHPPSRARLGEVDEAREGHDELLPRQLMEPLDHEQHINRRAVRAEAALLLLRQDALPLAERWLRLVLQSTAVSRNGFPFQEINLYTSLGAKRGSSCPTRSYVLHVLTSQT